MAFEDNERLDSIEILALNASRTFLCTGVEESTQNLASIMITMSSLLWIRCQWTTKNTRSGLGWDCTGNHTLRKSRRKNDSNLNEQLDVLTIHEKAVHAETERLEKLGAAERRSRRQEKENQRLELSRSEYHNRWKLLLSNTSADMPQAEIRFDDIPWPILPAFKKNEISTFLFTSCVPLADPSIDTAIGETISLSSSTSAQRLAEVEMAKARKDRKEKLRETLLCFHPDKFEGRLMSRVRPDEKVKVTEALAIIVRVLNDLMGRSGRQF
ncbi:hypothetical protein GGU10DRAFT_402206 [Lentinula aff. detonsa]|uniref:Uncharacterized protein n=1 Tax=Lentinula aff. detonsa TaxID=2804958 RepID=A0AA38NCJ2_9AGAR|nr:hypothetical protein GGU10DRAFT_402206 [Lentinula aff. detonsa]